VTDRSCPSCGLGVAPHQTLCPSCRTPVPSDPGPVAASAEGSGVTVSDPPPRRPRPQPSPPAPRIEPPEPTASAPGRAERRPAPAPVATHQVALPAPSSIGPALPSDATTTFGAAAPGPAGGDDVTAVAPVPRPGPAGPAVDERGNVPAGLLALAAAALVVAGVVLPWFEVAGEAVSGWRASADAMVLAGLAAGTTVVAALLIGGARSLALRLALVAGGLATMAIGAVEMASVGGLDDGLGATLSVGPFLVVGGGVVAALAGFATRHRRRR